MRSYTLPIPDSVKPALGFLIIKVNQLKLQNERHPHGLSGFPLGALFIRRDHRMPLAVHAGLYAVGQKSIYYVLIFQIISIDGEFSPWATITLWNSLQKISFEGALQMLGLICFGAPCRTRLYRLATTVHLTQYPSTIFTRHFLLIRLFLGSLLNTPGQIDRAFLINQVWRMQNRMVGLESVFIYSSHICSVGSFQGFRTKILSWTTLFRKVLMHLWK